MREFVKDGTVKAFALWNPGDLGYLAAYAAEALVDGDITGEEGDKFKAGKLGEYTVGADGAVLLGDPYVFDAEQHRRLQLLTGSGRAGASCAAGPAGHHPHTHPRRTRRQSDAARLLPAAGPPRPARGVPARHAAVWPEMLRALRDTGWHNYSLFLRDDGLLSATSRPTTSTPPRPAMDATDVNARWQAEMAPFFVDLDGARPDQGFLQLERGLPPRGPARRSRPTHARDVIDMTSFTDIDRPPRRAQAIEVPSWAFGNSGTRFKVFGTPGTPRTVEEKIADAAHGAPVHRPRADAWRCTSRGTRSTTTPRSRAYAEDLGVALGTINSNTFQDDDYKLGSLTHADPQVRREGDRPPPRVHRHHGRDRLARPEDLARRRHQLPGPGRHPRPPGPAGRVRCRRSTTGSATTSGWCWSTSSSSRRSTTPTSRTGARRYVARAPPSATGRWSASTPATTRPAPTSSSSSRSCCGSGSSARSTSTRRFYADDDLIVGAADPFQLFRIMFEVDPRRRLRRRQRRRASCSTSATTSRTKIPGQIRSVLNVQEMTATALLVDTRRARRGPAATATCSAPTQIFMDAFYTDVRADLRRLARGARPARPTRWRPTPPAATRSRSRPTASAAPRPDGELTMTDTSRTRRRRADRALATGSAPTRGTPTTPAATPRPRAPRPTRSPASPSSCCGSRAPAATSAR